MSKSRGNVIDPWAVIEARGADALRWNFVSAELAVERPSACRSRASTRPRTGSSLTLWNTYSFFVTYANLDGWEPGRRRRPAPTTCSTGGSGRGCTAPSARSPTRSRTSTRCAAAQALERVRRRPLQLVRPALAGPASGRPPTPTPTRCCTSASRTVTQLLAPFCPFVADELYQNLAGTDESVHLTDWPDASTPPRDRPGARARDGARPRGRLARPRGAHRVAAQAPPAAVARARAPARRASRSTAPVAAEIADALNVKELETVTILEGLLDYTVRARTSARSARRSASSCRR